jgi:hypothetical protein
MLGRPDLTILMPCLNEAKTIGTCIDKAQSYLARSQVSGEVLIADNGSNDGSQAIAMGRGARVLEVSARGYGSALRSGILRADSKWIVMGDGDDSYDFESLEPFVAELQAGADLVMGDRFTGGIEPKAMPRLHRYLGTPVLSWLGRRILNSKVRDFQCGLRGMRRAAILELDLQSMGMEFASEMLIKSERAGLRVHQVPTTLRPDGRERRPHLNTWRDGWRHLRLLMVYARQVHFLGPGIGALILGIILEALLVPGQLFLGPVRLAVGTSIIGLLLCLVGAQIIFLGVATKDYAQRNDYTDCPVWRFSAFFTTQTIFRMSLLLLLLGGLGLVHVIALWDANSLRYLSTASITGVFVPVATLLVVASTGIFTVLMSVLDEPAGRMGDAELRTHIRPVTRSAQSPAATPVPALAGSWPS